MKLVLASKNQGKLKEMHAILDRLGMEVVLQSEIGLDLDVEETGTTFEENSLLKAQAVMRASDMAAIADDSGLAVDALDGAPGVYSARYGGKGSDAARTALLLENMKAVPQALRTAKFVSVITCCFPDGRVVAARGECAGVIADEPRGADGFGYDPVFLLPQREKTFAELTCDEKNAISHRAIALDAFAQKLSKECINADK